MNIREAKEELRRTILAYTARTEGGTYRIPTVRQRPVLLMGPPGIGKTAIMEQIAEECGIGLVAYTMTHHTRQSAIGLPQIEKRVFDGTEYAVTDYTMSEILAAVYEQMERTKKREGILFLDEINCVSETLMPALLQFLQYKTFGNHRLPEGWIVAAAGNPVRYNQSVRELDTATLDRVKWLEIEPDLAVWKSYGRSLGIHPAVLAFLEWKPESFYAAHADQRGRQFVTARGCEDLSQMLLTLEELELPVDEKLPGQYLQHEGIAREFWIFYELYRKCREMPYEAMADQPFDERLCVLQLMLGRVYRQADEWKQTKELTESLKYFLEGCCRQAEQLRGGTHKTADAGSKKECSWLDICRRQLEQRQQGIRVKKECGILSPKEEEKEALLTKSLHKQFEIWRLAAVSGKGISLDPESSQVLEELCRRAEDCGQKLCALLREYTAFMEMAFLGKQELYLFSLGLLEHDSTADFLNKEMPELVGRLKENTDLRAYRKKLMVEMQQKREEKQE